MSNILSDLATLIRAGYKPDDINQLVKAMKDEPVRPAANDEEKVTAAVTAETPAEPDYKALYEAEHKKLEDIQKANTREEIKDDVISIDDIIKNIKTEIC